MSDHISPVVALLANLSIAAASEARLQEAILTSLRWGISHGEENDLGLKAVILRSPTQAIVYIDNNVAVKRLVSQVHVPLSGPLTASFSYAENISTEVINVTFNIVLVPKMVDNITRIAKEHCGNLSVAVYIRKECVFIRFPSVLTAMESISALENVGGVKSIKSICIGDHICLEGSWNGPITLKEASNNLSHIGSSLTALVQNCLGLYDDQPLVLAVRMLIRSEISENFNSSDLVLLCCTLQDAKSLLLHRKIELGYGCCIAINTATAKFSDNSNGHLVSSNLLNIKPESPSTNRRECYIFWDIENCPLIAHALSSNNEDDVMKIYANIDYILRKRFGYFESVVRILFGASEHGNFSHKVDCIICLSNCNILIYIFNQVSIKQQADLQALEFKYISYSFLSGSDIGMRAEVDKMIKKFHNIEKPIICLMTGETEFSSTLATLRLQHFRDILVVYTGTPVKAFLSLVAAAVAWSDIKQFHIFSDEQKTRLLRSLSSAENDRSDSHLKENSDESPVTNSFMNIICSASSSPSTLLNSSRPSSPPIETSTTRYRETIDLVKCSIATHFQNLLLWKSDAPSLPPQILLGENPTGGPEDSCIVTIDIDKQDKNFKRFTLVVTGPDEHTVKRRLKRLTAMRDLLLSDRRTHKLLRWKAEHREAAMGSAPFLAVQRKLHTTLMLHITDNVVLAEIVSLSRDKHQELMQYIESLEIRQDSWIMPTNILRDFTDRHWTAVRLTFAVKVEKSSKNVQKGVVRAYGFNPFFEKARQAITSGAKSIVIPPEGSSSDDNICLEPLVESAASSSTTLQLEQKPFTFTFVEREVVVFFNCFFNEFKNYFENSFGVQFIKSTSDNPLDSVVTTLEMTCTNSSSKVAALNYLSKLAKISRRQIFIPRVSQEKYKSLLELKVSLCF